MSRPTRTTRQVSTQLFSYLSTTMVGTMVQAGERLPLRKTELTGQIRALGVTPGAVLLVHTSFSRVGPVEGGPRGLIDALQAAVGPHGTLVMPSMSDDDEHPFDPRGTPCRGMGVVADAFWR